MFKLLLWLGFKRVVPCIYCKLPFITPSVMLCLYCIIHFTPYIWLLFLFNILKLKRIWVVVLDGKKVIRFLWLNKMCLWQTLETVWFLRNAISEVAKFSFRLDCLPISTWTVHIVIPVSFQVKWEFAYESLFQWDLFFKRKICNSLFLLKLSYTRKQDILCPLQLV